MVIDELIVQQGTQRMLVDSYADAMIDKIVVNGQEYNFAKQKDVAGVSNVVADNAVEEPIVALQVEGNTRQESAILPNEYQQVEYIESTGTQYIDTGIVASPLFEMVAVAQYTQNYAGTSGDAWSGLSASPSRIGFGYASSISSSNFAVLFASISVNTGIPFDTNKHEFVIQGNVTGKWNIDGSTGNTTGNVNSEFSKGTLPLILFARNAASGVGNLFKMRLYSFKFTDNNVLIRDFVPCYRKADNEIGLFDLVNGEFYTNQGTGTFAKGENYNLPPSPDYPQPIENANGEGMSVVLHGKNLATAQQVYPDFASSPVIRDGRTCIHAGGYTKFTLPNGFKEKTQYTVSFDILTELRNANEGGNPYVFFVKYKDVATDWNRDTILITKHTGEFQRVTLTTRANQTIDYIGPYSNTNRYYNYVDVNSFQFEEGTVATPYEPYFREETTIPSTVNDIPLRFAGVEGICDFIVANNSTRKVLYYQLFEQYQMTGDEEGGGAPLAVFQTNAPLINDSLRDYALCTHMKNQALGWVDTDYMFEAFDQNTGNISIMCYFPNTTSIEEIRSIIRQKYAEGEPFTFQYPLANVLIHDITDTDLGQSLSALATRKGTNYLEVKGNLTPSGTNISYWKQIIFDE